VQSRIIERFPQREGPGEGLKRQSKLKIVCYVCRVADSSNEKVGGGKGKGKGKTNIDWKKGRDNLGGEDGIGVD
jgi:hypothetical protein